MSPDKRRVQQAAPPTKMPKRPTPDGDVPRVIIEPSLDDYLEIMTRAIFQAGLSWAIITARWPAYYEAFDRFAVERVAGYSQTDIERLMSTPQLVHSEKKFVATRTNAGALLALEREGGGVARYLSGFASYAEVYADAHRRFAFLGDLNCYYWLFRTNNRVPLFEDWLANQKSDHPRMREMVLFARRSGTSPEKRGT